VRACAPAAFAAIVGIGSATAADVRDARAIPNLGDKGRETYALFLGEQPARAFAISGKGVYGWAAKQPTPVQAAAVALYHCNKLARDVCRVYAVNDDVVYPRYARFEEESARMRKRLWEETFAFADYGDEERDFNVAPSEALRTGNPHSETPLVLKGVRTVKTVELAKMMGSASAPLVVDVQEGDAHETLPGAYWIRGAGIGLEREEQNAQVRDRLGFVLDGLTGGNKGAALVFFCTDSRCWLSHNAALRARGLGYTNVLWYRGGVRAWKHARLATLEAVQFGQVR
jgi:PQQ-dependent catabolism-associated CXXCW motif protein